MPFLIPILTSSITSMITALCTQKVIEKTSLLLLTYLASKTTNTVDDKLVNQFSLDIKADFFIVSAKTKDNLKNLFRNIYSLAEDIYFKDKEDKSEQESESENRISLIPTENSSIFGRFGRFGRFTSCCYR